MAICSLRVSDRLVMRVGIRTPLAAGLGLVAASLSLSPSPRSAARTWSTCFLRGFLLGLGAGIAFNPVLLAAMGDVEPHEAPARGPSSTVFPFDGDLHKRWTYFQQAARQRRQRPIVALILASRSASAW